jgi:hypothetical protein
MSMLNNLSKQAKQCSARATTAELDAAETADTDFREELLDSATRWRKLARKYECKEQLQRFIYTPTKADNKKGLAALVGGLFHFGSKP